MADLKLHIPVSDAAEVDGDTLAPIGRGIRDADEGRTVPIETARLMTAEWIRNGDTI